MGVDLCFPLRGQPLLPGVTVCPSEWTCVCPIRGQCLLMGVDLCCTLRGQPLLPGVTICPSQWKCAYPLRGPPSPAWTRRGVPGGRTPRPYPCPHPHLHEGRPVHHVARVQSAGSSRCPPPCVPSAGPHASIQVLHDAQHLHTEVSHLCWAQRAAPVRGWACTEDAQLRATLATVKSTVLVLLGLRHCFWEMGSPGSLVMWSTEPRSRLWSWGWGAFLQSPASRSFRQSLGGSSLGFNTKAP